jgi:hypothetical protein
VRPREKARRAKQGRVERRLKQEAKELRLTKLEQTRRRKELELNPKGLLELDRERAKPTVLVPLELEQVDPWHLANPPQFAPVRRLTREELLKMYPKEQSPLAAYSTSSEPTPPTRD